MTRKDYVVIAETIKNVIERTKTGKVINFAGLAAAEEIARQLAYHMAKDNEKFDRQYFLSACGVN